MKNLNMDGHGNPSTKRPRVHQSHPQLHKGQSELHKTLPQRNQSRGLLEKIGDPNILKPQFWKKNNKIIVIQIIDIF